MAQPPSKSHGRISVKATAQPRELMTDRPHLKNAWTASVVTLLPQTFPGVLGSSLVGRALEQGLWRLYTTDLRRFGDGRHRNVDDTPAGGGAGMVLRADVMARALADAQRAAAGVARAHWPVIYLSPRGAPFTQDTAKRLSTGAGLTLICGRFEGLDQRVIDHFGIEEVSMGDFVLSGGEIAAQALIDATVRLIPRVLGNHASIEDESFSSGLLEYPQYTRPAVWEGQGIPEVLLSGNHAEIASWRRSKAERLTKERRPDLWRAYRALRDRDPEEDQEL
ncbi:MAG: tRNA (guanosine(37)-N1)-methyltransferase TrmD [Pseudomonadota bacterium]